MYLLRRPGRTRAPSLLSLLQLLLLLDVSLFQSLCLLLVLLLCALLSRRISLLLRHPLVVLFLFLLEFLSLLLLLGVELVLLLLVFPISLRVPRVGWSRAFSRWEVARMDCGAGTAAVRLIRSRPVGLRPTGAAIGWRRPRCSFFLGGYDSAVV